MVDLFAGKRPDVENARGTFAVHNQTVGLLRGAHLALANVGRALHVERDAPTP